MPSTKRKHALPQTFDRYVEAVCDPKTGKLTALRISVDVVPGRIVGLELGRCVRVVIEPHKKGKAINGK